MQTGLYNAIWSDENELWFLCKDIVQEIFAMYLNGYGYKKIARKISSHHRDIIPAGDRVR